MLLRAIAAPAMAAGMMIDQRAQRLLAFGAVALVWLFAGAAGLQIGLDLGRAIFD